MGVAVVLAMGESSVNSTVADATPLSATADGPCTEVHG